MATSQRLTDLFRFRGIRPYATARAVFGDPKARVLDSERRGGESRCGVCDTLVHGIYDRKVRRVRDLSCGGARIYLEIELRRVGCRCCGAVKPEKLPCLADSPFYTKRFAFLVGRRCRTALSDSDDLGCGTGAASGLARCQGTGQAIYARAVHRIGTPVPMR